MFSDFDIFGIAVSPREADAVLIVNPNAVLAFPVAAQLFQPVARRNQEIGQSLRAIEGNQASKRHFSDAGKFLDPLAPEQPPGFLGPEAPDHQSTLAQFCVVRQAYNRARWCRGQLANLDRHGRAARQGHDADFQVQKRRNPVSSKNSEQVEQAGYYGHSR
ncbi:MAG TPA: hypothetical protein VKB84_23995 [Candidatus Binataceae bacterium]|nr:hypothetical protein [Candidatus Binataceae bacterium]